MVCNRMSKRNDYVTYKNPKFSEWLVIKVVSILKNWKIPGEREGKSLPKNDIWE